MEVFRWGGRWVLFRYAIPMRRLVRPTRKAMSVISDEVLQAGNGGKDVRRTQNSELEEVANVKDEISVEVFVQEFFAFFFNKHLECQTNLAIANEPKNREE